MLWYLCTWDFSIVCHEHLLLAHRCMWLFCIVRLWWLVCFCRPKLRWTRANLIALMVPLQWTMTIVSMRYAIRPAACSDFLFLPLLAMTLLSYRAILLAGGTVAVKVEYVIKLCCIGDCFTGHLYDDWLIFFFCFARMLVLIARLRNLLLSALLLS